ncbi:hypothetical protein, partial [Planomonospora algeriensis]
PPALPASSPHTTAKPDGPVGFPVHGSLLTVTPRSAKNDSLQELEADLSCAGFSLPTTSARVVVSDPQGEPALGTEHRIVGSALLTAELQQGASGISWTLYVEGIVPTAPADPEPRASASESTQATHNPETSSRTESQAWERMEKAIEEIVEARKRKDVNTLAHLYEEAFSIMENLSDGHQKLASELLENQRKPEKKAREEKLKPSEVAEALDRTLDHAFREVAAMNFSKVRGLYGKALGLFKIIPIEETGSRQERLRELRQAIRQDMISAVTPRAATAAPERPVPSYRFGRNRIGYYISLIQEEMKGGKARVGYVRRLCDSLENLLERLPGDEYGAERARLDEFRQWIRDSHHSPRN